MSEQQAPQGDMNWGGIAGLLLPVLGSLFPRGSTGSRIAQGISGALAGYGQMQQQQAQQQAAMAKSEREDKRWNMNYDLNLRTANRADDKVSGDAAQEERTRKYLAALRAGEDPAAALYEQPQTSGPVLPRTQAYNGALPAPTPGAPYAPGMGTPENAEQLRLSERAGSATPNTRIPPATDGLPSIDGVTGDNGQMLPSPASAPPAARKAAKPQGRFKSKGDRTFWIGQRAHKMVGDAAAVGVILPLNEAKLAAAGEAGAPPEPKGSSKVSVRMKKFADGSEQLWVIENGEYIRPAKGSELIPNKSSGSGTAPVDRDLPDGMKIEGTWKDGEFTPTPGAKPVRRWRPTEANGPGAKGQYLTGLNDVVKRFRTGDGVEPSEEDFDIVDTSLHFFRNYEAEAAGIGKDKRLRSIEPPPALRKAYKALYGVDIQNSYPTFEAHEKIKAETRARQQARLNGSPQQQQGQAQQQQPSVSPLESGAAPQQQPVQPQPVQPQPVDRQAQAAAAQTAIADAQYAPKTDEKPIAYANRMATTLGGDKYLKPWTDEPRHLRKDEARPSAAMLRKSGAENMMPDADIQMAWNALQEIEYELRKSKGEGVTSSGVVGAGKAGTGAAFLSDFFRPLAKGLMGPQAGGRARNIHMFTNQLRGVMREPILRESNRFSEGDQKIVDALVNVQEGHVTRELADRMVSELFKFLATANPKYRFKRAER